MKLTGRLIEAMRSEFGKSKKWYNRSIITNFVMFVSSAILIITVGNLSVILGLCLFIFPIALFIFRELSMEYQNRAEKIRRSLILADALDHKPSEVELAQLRIDLGTIDRSEPLFDKRYYDSKVPVGVNRLVDILAESALFTHNLCKRAVLIFSLMIGVGIIAICSSIYMLLSLGVNCDVNTMFAKLMALFMVFLVSGDFAYLCRRYYCLSLASKEVLDKTQILARKGAFPVEGALRIVDDYNCAVIQAPPIPGFIYKSMLKPLNEAWREKKCKGQKND